MSVDQPQPNHPLTAIRRQGVVQDVANAPTTVNVFIGGDLNTLVACSYIASYHPFAGDKVLVLANQGDYMIVGVLGTEYYEEYHRSATQTATNGVTATIIYDTLDVSRSATGQAYTNGGSGVWTCPGDGIYTISASGDLDALAGNATRLLFSITTAGGVVWSRSEPGGGLLGSTPEFQLSRTAFIASGLQLHVEVFQNSGANRLFGNANHGHSISFLRH